MSLSNITALILIAAMLALMAHPPPPAASASSCRPEPAARPIWDMRRLNAALDF